MAFQEDAAVGCIFRDGPEIIGLKSASKYLDLVLGCSAQGGGCFINGGRILSIEDDGASCIFGGNGIRSDGDGIFRFQFRTAGYVNIALDFRFIEVDL